MLQARGSLHHTLRSLRSQTRRIDDFMGATLEASRLDLIDEGHFRRWFTTYVSERNEMLLAFLRLRGDSDEMKFCRILVSALAHAKNDDGQSKEPLGSKAKKRKFNATVEDAPASDGD